MKRLLLIGFLLMATFSLFGTTTRVTTSGDEEGCKAYFGEAQRLLYQLRKCATTQNVPIYALERRFQNSGVVMTARTVHGREEVTIYKPLMPKKKEEAIPNQGLFYFGSTYGEVWTITPKTLAIKGPYSHTGAPTQAQLCSAIATKNTAVFATYGFWDSYIASYRASGLKLSVNVNPPVTNGISCMCITSDKTSIIAGQNSTSPSWYPGVTYIDPVTLQVLDTVPLSYIDSFTIGGVDTDDTVTLFSVLTNNGLMATSGFTLYSGNIYRVWTLLEAAIVKKGSTFLANNPGNYASLSANQWDWVPVSGGSGWLYINVSGVPTNMFVAYESKSRVLMVRDKAVMGEINLGDRVPGTVIYDPKRKVFYISTYEDDEKYLYKVDATGSILGTLALSGTVSTPARGAIYKKDALFLATYDPLPYRLIKIDLDTFTENSTSYTFPPVAAGGGFEAGNSVPASILTDDESIYVGVYEGYWGSSVFKINPKTMELEKQKRLTGSQFHEVYSGAYLPPAIIQGQ